MASRSSRALPRYESHALSPSARGRQSTAHDGARLPPAPPRGTRLPTPRRESMRCAGSSTAPCATARRGAPSTTATPTTAALTKYAGTLNHPLSVSMRIAASECSRVRELREKPSMPVKPFWSITGTAGCGHRFSPFSCGPPRAAASPPLARLRGRRAALEAVELRLVGLRLHHRIDAATYQQRMSGLARGRRRAAVRPCSRRPAVHTSGRTPWLTPHTACGRWSCSTPCCSWCSPPAFPPEEQAGLAGDGRLQCIPGRAVHRDVRQASR